MQHRPRDQGQSADSQRGMHRHRNRCPAGEDGQQTRGENANGADTQENWHVRPVFSGGFQKIDDDGTRGSVYIGHRDRLPVASTQLIQQG